MHTVAHTATRHTNRTAPHPMTLLGPQPHTLQPVYSPAQLQQWEQHWFDQGNSSFGLMQQAALQVAQAVDRDFQAEGLPRHTPICVLVGTGNNGGDGWLTALYLHQLGWNVTVYAAVDPTTEDSRRAQHMAREGEVTIVSLGRVMPEAVIYLDALFGLGLNRPAEGILAQLIQRINQRVEKGLSRVFAIDVPSGLSAGSGQLFEPAFAAERTYCLIAHKIGLLTAMGPAWVGELTVLPLMPAPVTLQPIAYLQDRVFPLPHRPKTAHKGSFGHVLVIGGAIGMTGAVLLSAEAALRCGAGKVTAVMHSTGIGPLIARNPGIMTLSLPFQESEDQYLAGAGEQDFFGSASTVDEREVQRQTRLSDLLREATTIIVGPGMGRSAAGEQLLDWLLPRMLSRGQSIRVVMDADALYHMAELPDFPSAESVAHWIFTPHPGEAARLLGCSISDVENDRYHAVLNLQLRYGGRWVLKGAGSLVMDAWNRQGDTAETDLGQDAEEPVSPASTALTICGLGNPGMATAGMGDVLAGVIAGVIAQFPDYPLAETVALHAAAGDRAAVTVGEHGLTASDVIEQLADVMRCGSLGKL